MDDQERKDTEEKAKIYVKEKNKSKGKAFDSLLISCFILIIICVIIGILITP